MKKVEHFLNNSKWQITLIKMWKLNNRYNKREKGSQKNNEQTQDRYLFIIIFNN